MKPIRVIVRLERRAAVWVGVVESVDSTWAVLVDETGAIYVKPLRDIVCDDPKILKLMEK